MHVMDPQKLATLATAWADADPDTKTAEEVRALVAKQKICPVSGEALGAMGAPIKLTVAGHDVFVCCESCEEPLKTDPAKHLAKIGLTPAQEGAVQ